MIDYDAWDLLRLSRMTDGAVSYLLPMTQYVVRRANRSKRIHHVPLFSGIIFVCVADESLDLDPNHRTWGEIAVADSGQKKLRDDLQAVETFALTDASRMNPFPFAKIGARVRVCNGPFQNFKGEVIYAEGQRRKFIILIDCLGQKVSYELDDNIDIEPVAD
jgi:transcription antitermination factor NusG